MPRTSFASCPKPAGKKKEGSIGPEKGGKKKSKARGRDGIVVEMRTFQLYRVREGKLAVYRVYLSEQEALKAVGLAE